MTENCRAQTKSRVVQDLTQLRALMGVHPLVPADLAEEASKPQHIPQVKRSGQAATAFREILLFPETRQPKCFLELIQTSGVMAQVR